jgi:hypothetical protein
LAQHGSGLATDDWDQDLNLATLPPRLRLSPHLPPLVLRQVWGRGWDATGDPIGNPIRWIAVDVTWVDRRGFQACARQWGHCDGPAWPDCQPLPLVR